MIRGRMGSWRPCLQPRLSPQVRHFSSTFAASASRLSTVHRGNAFEERSLKLLQQTMSMSLKRVGGKEDGGVDLVGWWWLPHEASSTSSWSPPSTAGRRRLRVIGQCKAEKKKMGPNYVRELEGVSYGLLARGPTVFPVLSSDNENGAWTEFGQDSSIPLVALLISQSAFTKSTILRAHSSSIPFFLLHLPSVEGTPVNVEEAEDGDSRDVAGNLGSVYCNSALSGMQGLLKGYMEVRWERHFSGESGRPALWWKDKRLQSWTPDHPPLVERMG